ncbi:MAG: alpha/beta hydrolase [Lachnospiraceae bacterium]|jgi:pimeloyl-ACP methyl ester carboxylesterase|nr:alpha/beta hydrolase [Lachnospiraceae bacterium]
MYKTEKICNTVHGEIYYWTVCAEEERPWLVFLPGLTADHRLFEKQLEGLGDQFNCLVWDAPAHGKSRPFDLGFSLDHMAKYLHKILRREGILRPVLIGQSLGGYISQAYMDLFPGEAAGFISIDSCSLHRRYYTDIELWLLKHTKWMYLSIPWKWLKRLGTTGNAETEYGRKIMKDMWKEYNKKEFCALSTHGFRILAEAVEKERAYQITCPVLLLCGEKDSAGSGKRYIKNWMKTEHYPFVWVPDAGHNSNTDAPEFVNNQIREFVLALPSKRG